MNNPSKLSILKGKLTNLEDKNASLNISNHIGSHYKAASGDSHCGNPTCNNEGCTGADAPLNGACTNTTCQTEGMENSTCTNSSCVS